MIPAHAAQLPEAVTRRGTVSLRRSASWTVSGNVVYAACQWAMIVALARLGTPAVVGRFSLGLAVTAPIMLFATLKLRSVQATDVHGEFRFGDYLALRLLMTALGLVAVAVVIVAGGYRGETAAVITILAVAKAAELISDLFYGAMQRQERLDLIARSLMIKGALSLVALTFAFAVTGSLVWATGALAGTWVAVLVGYDLRRAASGIVPADVRGRLVRPAWNRETLWSLARLTAPLGALTAVGSLASNVPRYVVEERLGEHELGIFSAILYLLVVGNLLVTALAQAATPRLANYLAAGAIDEFRRLITRMIAGGVLLGVAAIVLAGLAGRHLLVLLYGDAYATQTGTLVWVAVASGIGFAHVFLGTAVTAMRRFTVQLPIHLASLVALVALCGILVDRHGTTGAAVAMVAAASVQALCYAVVVRRLVFPPDDLDVRPMPSAAS